MYKVTVPIMNYTVKRSGREGILEELKKLDAERVLLAGAYILDKEERALEFEALRDNIAYFKEKGFEVGVWYWSFLIDKENDFTKMVSIGQKPTTSFIHPPTVMNFAMPPAIRPRGPSNMAACW